MISMINSMDERNNLRNFLGGLRQSSVFFRNFLQYSNIFESGKVRVAFGQCLESIQKSLENGWKSSENRHRRRF